MDHSELGENIRIKNFEFRFKFVEPSNHDEVLKVLEDYLYIAMEPIGYKPEFAEDFNNMFSGILKSGHNLSYMAVDAETGEIAAVRMVDLVPKSRPADLPPFKHKANLDSFKFCGELQKDVNLFEEYGVTEFPDMFGMCVTEKYRKLGLATEMYTRGLNYMKKRGYKIVKCGFVSPYTRRAGVKHGYIESARGRFLDCKDSEGNILNPNADPGPDGFICFGLFDLRNY